MNELLSRYYQKPDGAQWTGRVDGSQASDLRWHQTMECIDVRDYSQSLAGQYVLLGFACDEGVRRNLGRVGASRGPTSICQALANLPVHHEDRLFDAGLIQCTNGNLEEAQVALCLAVAKIRELGGFPILLGGGHEITYGHYMGLRRASPGKIGIINIDAHFDLREPIQGEATSGTGFYQIAEQVGVDDFHYLALGIQRISNTRTLFTRAQQYGVTCIAQSEICDEWANRNREQLVLFFEKVDQVYLTIDLDAFAASIAPGVSAPAFQGIFPDASFWKLLELIYSQPKLIAMDLAEFNPLYDIDSRTARLAADLIFKKVSQ